MFVLMTSPNGKRFHHVYKVGRAHNPKVLQGVFSGVSSAFDPIGGRCVLVRTNDDFRKMENQRISVATLKKAKDKVERALGAYFEDQGKNNLLIGGVTTYDAPDLT